MSIWSKDVFMARSCWHMEGSVVINGPWGPDRVNKRVCSVSLPRKITPLGHNSQCDFYKFLLCVRRW